MPRLPVQHRKCAKELRVPAHTRSFCTDSTTEEARAAEKLDGGMQLALADGTLRLLPQYP